MPLPWTPDQILAFAPDASSAKAGRGLADSRHWSNAGQSARALWGECQGSGKLPYQTQVDLSEPAFKCSCPSRKFPCKHGLGLLLLAEAKPLDPISAEPEWVEQWLLSRTARAVAKEEKKKDEKPPDPEAQAQRAANRAAKVTAGLDDLELWLRDLISQGLATVGSKDYSFWDSRAARLVDAQAPGIARLIRELPAIAASGAGWPERLLERLGMLKLAIDAWRNIASLPEETQADLRTLIGFTTPTAELTETCKDKWFVLGRTIEQEDRLRVQRTWLIGTESKHDLLVLDFAIGNASLDSTLAPGLTVEAEAALFPGAACPRRAILKERTQQPVQTRAIPHCQSILSESQRYRETLAKRPWLERFPMRLAQVIPVSNAAGWTLRDEAGHELALAGKHQWTLAAVSQGRPISLFGEWDGYALTPLSIAAGSRLIALESAPQ